MKSERDEARERLLDVLLEEEFGEAMPVMGGTERSERSERSDFSDAAVPVRLRMLLVAALLLLGTGVVVAVTCLRRVEVSQWAALRQDPVGDPTLVVARDVEHFFELVQQATGVSIVQQDVIGAAAYKTENGVGDRLELVAQKEVLHITGGELERWQLALRTGLGKRASQTRFGTVLHLDVLLPAGKKVRCFLSIEGADVYLAVDGDDDDDIDPFVPAPALRELLVGAQRELEHRHRRARGVVLSLDELAALPADNERIECPVSQGDALALPLQRFAGLRQLCLRGEPSAEVLGDLQQQVRLQELELVGAALDAERFAALAKVRQLRVLVLRKCTGIDRVSLRGLRDLSALHTLHCIDSPLGVDGDALQELVSLPALREFGCRLPDLELTEERFEPFLRTKLNRLLLVDVDVRADVLAKLAGLPTLLDLVLVMPIDDRDLQGLEPIASLRRLTLRNAKVTQEGLDELRLHLPQCLVDGRPNARWFDTAYAFHR